MNGAVHDKVGLVIGFARSFALVLPALLHGQDTEHDSLRGADCARAHGVHVVIVCGDIEKACNHRDAAILNVWFVCV